MTLTTISACVAATLSLCVSQAPSHTRDLRDTNPHAITGGAGAAWTGAVTAPAGAKLILAGYGGIKRG